MIEKKIILILGGNYSTVAVVNYAHELGLYVIVTSNTDQDGDAKRIADETWEYSSDDFEHLVPMIKERNVSGVMTGASEFHLLNMIRLCKLAGLPVYATEEQWNLCQNKKTFKKLCRDFGVPCVQEFSADDDPATFDYPIIVKPTDGCSARGITVCYDAHEYSEALEKALGYSTEKKVIIEKYLPNNGTTMSVKYVAIDGELYLEAIGDRYVLEHERGKALITAAAFYPSKYIDLYMRTVDEKVKAMYKGIGLRNGVLFMEAIANQDGIWLYEMGLRVSGGMTYKITEKTTGINELKMLISYATTGKMCEVSDISKIDPYFNGFLSASLCIPLTIGRIGCISGMDAVKAISEVGNVTQYWSEGEELLPRHMSTLDQLFARIPVIVRGKIRLAEIIKELKENLSVKDVDGNEMIIWSKLDDIYNDYMG